MSGPVDLIVIGGGDHARVVIEAARTQPDRWNVVGFANLRPCPETDKRLNVPYLGGDEQCYCQVSAKRFVLGLGAIGVSQQRPKLAARYDRHAARWATIVHTSAWVSPSATLGKGVVVLAGAIVNCGAVIGDHCIVNTGAIIEHHVRLGDYTQVGPGTAIGGGTTVGEGSYLGLGCRIRDHIQIGSRVVVGMGAVVVGPIADEQIVVGVPARPLSTKPANVPHIGPVTHHLPPQAQTR